MQQDEQKEHGQQVEPEEEDVICSNQLLAAIRERMAKKRKGPEENRPRKLDIEEGD
jgi:hypothetical protein